MYYSFESKSLQTINAYQQSATRFFSNITTEIKSLKIERNVFDNTMEALANSDTKLTNLIYKGTLKDLKQMQYISQIKSLKEMRVVIFPSTKLNLQVLPYNSITKLDVCNSGEAVYFDWLLLSFPCLQVLDINEGDGWTLSDDDNGRSVSMLSNLWSLHVNVNSLDQKCIDFLVLKAPNIKKLSIISETCVAGMRNVNIDISQWELKELALEFRDLNHNDNYYYNIKTPYVDKIVRRSRVYDSMALLGGGGHSYGEKKPPMITIISENDKQFVFYNYKLSIMQSDLSITLYAK
jgi:hypothetical protein